MILVSGCSKSVIKKSPGGVGDSLVLLLPNCVAKISHRTNSQWNEPNQKWQVLTIYLLTLYLGKTMKELCFRCKRPTYFNDKVGPLKDGVLFHKVKFVLVFNLLFLRRCQRIPSFFQFNSYHSEYLLKK